MLFFEENILAWSWIGSWRDRFEDLKRHFLIVTKRPTPTRWFNFLVNELCAKFRTLTVPGYPYVLVTDPTNCCNLRCPLCPTGLGMQGRLKGNMPWNLYLKILREMTPWAMRIWFFNWGEPLLNPRIFDMIAEANRRGLATNLSTNVQLLDREKTRQLLDSQLDYLIISMDGFDAESYSKYRIGASFDRAMENIRYLLEEKKRRRQTSLRVEWQSLVTSFNQDKLDRISNLASQTGVDRVRFMPLELADSPWTGRSPGSEVAWLPDSGTPYRYDFSPSKPLSDHPCFWLYETITINPDGGVAPCCRTFEAKDDFGNVNQSTIRSIFNNTYYQRARALFKKGTPLPGKPIVCDRCQEYTHAQ